MTTETILLRVKKLLAHANSAAQLNSTEEAAAFAAKANALLLEHKLSLSDVELGAADASDPMTETMVGERKNNRIVWYENLVQALCRANFCSPLLWLPDYRFSIIGRDSDVQVVVYLIDLLIRTGVTLANRYVIQHCRLSATLGASRPDRPKTSFLLGFVEGIAEQLSAQRERTANQHGGSIALVRLTNAIVPVRAYMTSKYPHLGTSRAKKSVVKSSHGFASGLEAGRTTPLTPAAGSGAQHLSLKK